MILNDIVGQVKSFLSHGNDDAVDKFHYRYTVIGLAVFLLLITSKQYYGDPIQCFTSSVANSDMRSYIHSVCWLNGTYRMNHSFASTAQDQKLTPENQLKYYQWIIFIVIFQCFLFSLPSILWEFVSRLNGFNIDYISKSVIKKNYNDYYANQSNWGKVENMLENVSDHLKLSFLLTKSNLATEYVHSITAPEINSLGQQNSENYLNESKNNNEKSNDYLKKIKMAQNRRNNPNLKSKTSFSLFWPFIFIKILYLTNVIFHYILLSKIFKIEYFSYGITLVSNMISGKYEFDNVYFPKTSWCQTNVRGSDKNPYGTVCALPVNLFNEIFYSGFWFWLWILALLTITSLAYWLTFISKSYRQRHVLSLMNIQFNISSQINKDDLENENDNQVIFNKTGLTLEENFNLFFNDVCSLDLVLVINLLTINSNPLVSKDILFTLWHEYLNLKPDFSNENKTHQRRPLPTLRKTPFDMKRAAIADNNFNNDDQNQQK